MHLAIFHEVETDYALVATDHSFLSLSTSRNTVTGLIVSVFLRCVLLVTYAKSTVSALVLYVTQPSALGLMHGDSGGDAVRPTRSVISARGTVLCALF